MYQTKNPYIIVCFCCEGEKGFYNEFIDHGALERPACPSCGGSNTLPKYYIELMPIPRLVRYFQDVESVTGIRPFKDLRIKDFRIPHILGVPNITA